MKLELLGWHSSLEKDFASSRETGFAPARVAEEHRERYLVFCEEGELSAEVTGRLRFTASTRLDFPAVGDWVAMQPNGDSAAVIHAVLPRKTAFIRKSAGLITEAQVVAANVDLVFIVTDADRDFNPRRLERYLTLAWESGVSPVIVLNKADLSGTIPDLVRETGTIAAGVPIFPISAIRGEGIDPLRACLGRGRTVALIGSSGVGKSTLINRLLGEDRLKTSAIRAGDGRGRHTTSSRQLLLLPDGSVVIDTPGMREIQLWADEESLDAAFQDIENLAAGCRFTDCKHAAEPGCAVRGALEDETLSRSRFESYQKLRREVRFLERKQDVKARLAEQARWKRIHRASREHMRMKYGSS